MVSGWLNKNGLNMNKIRNIGILIIIFLIYFSFSESVDAQVKLNQKYKDIAEEIRIEGLQNGQAYKLLEQLTTAAPTRLAGSSGAAAAVEITRQMMLNFDFENVHLESTVVPRWVRGEEVGKVVNSTLVGTVPLVICALGGSIPTPEIGIAAPVIEVHSFDELQQIGDQAKGKIVFFNRPMDPTEMNAFAAYGGAVNQRSQGAIEGAKIGAVAVLVRSITTRIDNVPHTGMMNSDPQVPKIPAAAISTKDANFLSDLLKNEKSVNVHLKMTCQTLSPVPSANVIGQITGSEKSNEIVLVGGHLDSWDLGVGAHDDGAGCIHSIEALRLIKNLGLKPKRTIRVVMFMNEEFGGTGGQDYAIAPQRKDEKHIVAIESDRGGFLPEGFGVGGDESTLQKVQSWFPFFEPLGMYWIRRGGGGVDIGPLAKYGTVLMSIIPDDQRYFDVHHSGNDVLETVNERELELGAIALAIMVYMLAEEGI